MNAHPPERSVSNLGPQLRVGQSCAMNGRVASAVACGYAHSLALCENFEVLAWGSGWKGKLGLGDDHNRLVPTLIPSLKRKHLKQVRAGWVIVPDGKATLRWLNRWDTLVSVCVCWAVVMTPVETCIVKMNQSE